MTPTWLITGPAGSGRSVVALAFAAALQCETRTGCGQCPPCEAVLTGSHADLVIVIAEGLSIRIEEARDARAQGGHRHPASAASASSSSKTPTGSPKTAENTLLKTLEEPPERTVIMLCAPSRR